jgi:hypothetical protein
MPKFGYQESQLVACRIAPRYADLRVLAEHTGTTTESPLAVSGVSELCLETGVNVFGRDTLLAEKPNNDSLAGFHPLNKNP